MITYVDGDLFQSPAKVLVNPVNTVGVMGKGLAGEFKRIYPDMFSKYRKLCEKKQFNIGQLWLYKTPHKWVLNFPTKEDWRHKSRPKYIEAGLRKFVASYDEKGIVSISFPLLGCGNGELDWETQVRPLMEQYLKSLPITVYIHTYRKSDLVPEHYDTEAIRQWLKGEPQMMPFQEFWKDLEELINAKRNFMTLDTKIPFSVRVDETGVEIHPEGELPFSLPKEENGLLELWQHLRAAGYCMQDRLPFGMDVHASYIVSLLGELDYINPISFPHVDGESQMGLQLILKSDENPKAFEATPEHSTPT